MKLNKITITPLCRLIYLQWANIWNQNQWAWFSGKISSRMNQHLKDLWAHAADVHHFDKTEPHTWDIYNHHFSDEDINQVADYIVAMTKEDSHAAKTFTQELIKVCENIVTTHENPEHRTAAGKLHKTISKIHWELHQTLEPKFADHTKEARDKTLKMYHSILEKTSK